MLKINNLKRQHSEIKDIVKNILTELDNKAVEDKAYEISKSISILAGKLKIHLNEEDRWLYPSMKNSSDPKLIKFQNIYYSEMEGLFSSFVDYKNKYNTKTKILSNINDFIDESNNILTSLLSRIEKEDNHLYPLLDD